VQVHNSYDLFCGAFRPSYEAGRVFALTTKGVISYSEVKYQQGDVLLFGPESRGLPEQVRGSLTQLRIPMKETRSLNLAVSVAVVVYEAWRQQAFQ
jgi:tRNA (cytidine/uridine-2'-O-)-methyltransferase